MRRLFAGVAAACLLAGLSACADSSGPLPPGADLGYGDVDDPESYSGATLYTYMDGGADIYLEYGFSSLAVRRYADGTTRLIAELFEMKDEAAAAGIYGFSRRAGSEKELLAGCTAGVTDTEILLARGRYYLVCRNEDPMATNRAALETLAARLAGRLAGGCGAANLLASSASGALIPGSEIVLVGPVGLNARAWLAGLNREGFQKGRLAEYRVPGGTAEGFTADYSTPELARVAAAQLKTGSADLRAKSRERKIAIIKIQSGAPTDVDALLEQLLR